MRIAVLEYHVCAAASTGKHLGRLVERNDVAGLADALSDGDRRVTHAGGEV